MLFLVLAGAIAFYFIILRWDQVAAASRALTGILMPFVYGLVLAFLISPSYNFFVRQFGKIYWPTRHGGKKSPKAASALATICAVLEILLVIAALLWLIIPQLITSISSLAAELPGAIGRAIAWIEEKQALIPDLSHQAEAILQRMSEEFIKWVEETLIPSYTGFISGFSTGIVEFVRQLLNFIIGIIISVYLLNRKTVMLGQCKKLVLAVFKEETAEGILRGASFVNKTFWNFISGKVMDSTIIGIICFAVMKLLGWPYAALISVVIGVTNIIPFFGPFIGAIPSTLLMLMESPKLALFFLIFVLLLQQLDGNIIGPRILGESMGLSSFWVMFAILVGGGLFGVLGMLLGVPVFAVIYAYLCYYIDLRLAKKGMPILVTDYKDLYRYDGRAPNELFYEEQGLIPTPGAKEQESREDD